jgi:hypothetical protein
VFLGAKEAPRKYHIDIAINATDEHYTGIQYIGHTFHEISSESIDSKTQLNGVYGVEQ